MVAVPRAHSPPLAPEQHLKLHYFDARCNVSTDEVAGGIVVVSDPPWPALDTLLPGLKDAPRRVMTLEAKGERPLHIVAATLDDCDRRSHARWALVTGEPERDMRLLADREQSPNILKGHSGSDHILSHSCQTPYVFAPTPTLLFRLHADAPWLLLTADERSAEKIRMELWQLGDDRADLRLTYPTEFFSPWF